MNRCLTPLGTLLLACLLSGCSTDNLELAGALITYPAYAAKESVSNAAEVRQFRKLQQGVAKDDRQALLQAMLFKPSYHSQVADDEFIALLDQAADKLVLLDQPGLPQDEVLPMLYAYERVLQRQSGSPAFHIDSALADRAWQLVQPLADKDLWKNDLYKLRDKLAVYVFLTRVQDLPEKQANLALENCYSGALMPVKRDIYLCRDAYKAYVGMHSRGRATNIKTPQTWEQHWKQQDNDRDKIWQAQKERYWKDCGARYARREDVWRCVQQAVADSPPF